jgi:hypothetical protein
MAAKMPRATAEAPYPEPEDSPRRDARRGAKGGARIDQPTQLFRIRPAMQASADEQPSLVLLVRGSGELSATMAAARAGEAATRPCLPRALRTLRVANRSRPS